jgi:hypothetical protein
LHKSEWLDNFSKARQQILTEKNILAGWRGAGLFPLNRQRVLRQIDSQCSALSPSRPHPATSTTPLISSSPPDAAVLRAANVALNATIVESSLESPVRRHVRQLGSIAEQLQADNCILRKENNELKAVIDTRKERASGKRLILKGVKVVMKEYIYQELEKAEAITKERKRRKGRKGKIATQDKDTSDSEEENTRSESEKESEIAEKANCIMHDCIEVKFRKRSK